MNHRELALKANWARRTVLEMAVKADGGHVTTAFSLAEIFTVLYSGVLRYDPKDPTWESRDRFILSEGQAGIGLYPFLAQAGFFPLEALDNFVGEESTLGVHSEPGTPGVEVLTGSLGFGPGIACGMAQALKLKATRLAASNPRVAGVTRETASPPGAAAGDPAANNPRVLVLVGDGELTEGSCDEAWRNIAALDLDNLTVLINRNGQSTIGYCNERSTQQRDLRLEDLILKFRSYGFAVEVIDGHDFDSLNAVLGVWRYFKRPTAVIANTEKGYGCHLVNQRGWHYRVPKGDDLERIRTELERQRQQLEEPLELVRAAK